MKKYKMKKSQMSCKYNGDIQSFFAPGSGDAVYSQT
jgi:hypothetical protein